MLTDEQKEFLNVAVNGTWKETPNGIDVDGSVWAGEHDLTKIPVKFNHVTKHFDCTHNPNLTSLEGCPKKVGGTFYCYHNNLTSLEGCPKKVGGNFYCYHNNLTSLEGCPKKVGGIFDCTHNNLTSLEGCPKEIGGNFYCYHNPIQTYRHLKNIYFKIICISKYNIARTFDDLILTSKKESDILKYVPETKIKYADDGSKSDGLFKLAALIKHKY